MDSPTPENDVLPRGRDRTIRLIAVGGSHEPGARLSLRVAAGTAHDVVGQVLVDHPEVVVLVVDEPTPLGEMGRRFWDDLPERLNVRVFAASRLAETVVAAAIRGLESYGVSLEEDPPARVSLTPRERTIVAAMVRGLSTKQMAATLGLSASTVKTLRKRIYTKLAVSNSAAAVAAALRDGLVLDVDDGSAEA